MSLRLIAFLLLPAALSACAKHAGLQVGDSMPSVALSDVRGQAVRLPDDYKGKILLLRFWSLDCGFCDKATLFTLERIYQKYRGQGFMPVAVNESRLEPDDARLKPFAELNYPLLQDEYNKAAKQFGVVALPMTFIVDEAGIIRKKLAGEAQPEELEKLVTTILYKGEFYENGH